MSVKYFQVVFRLTLLTLVMSSSAALRGQQTSCNDLCAFIKNVLKEEPTGFAKFKGHENDGGHLTYHRWEATYKPPEPAGCFLTNDYNSSASSWWYTCDFRHSADSNDDSGFSKEEGPKKYAQVVEALKSALPEGWEFKETKWAAMDLSKGILGPGYVTVANQTSTKIRIVARLDFWGDAADAEASLRLVFCQRPAAGAAPCTIYAS